MPGIGHFRAHARRRVHLGLSLRQAGEDLPARMVNLGLSGACLELARPLALTTRVLLHIVAPTLWDPLVLEGVVVWTRRENEAFRVGLRFEHTGEHAVGALFELLFAEQYDDAT